MVRRASFGWFDVEGSRRSLGVTIGGAVVISEAEGVLVKVVVMEIDVWISDCVEVMNGVLVVVVGAERTVM